MVEVFKFIDAKFYVFFPLTNFLPLTKGSGRRPKGLPTVSDNSGKPLLISPWKGEKLIFKLINNKSDHADGEVAFIFYQINIIRSKMF